MNTEIHISTTKAMTNTVLHPHTSKKLNFVKTCVIPTQVAWPLVIMNKGRLKHAPCIIVHLLLNLPC